MKRYLFGLIAALGLGLGAASAIYAQTMTPEPTTSPTPTMSQNQQNNELLDGDQDMVNEENLDITGAPDTGMGGLAQ